MKDALIVSLLSVVPKNGTARFMGSAARLRLPRPLHRLLLRWYVAKYRVNLDEVDGDIDSFDSLAEFFVRGLVDGARPIDPDPEVLCSPVDAHVHSVGRIVGGQFEQSPGMPCSVDQLVGTHDPRSPGGCPLDPQRFRDGHYAVLYLSPKDYHRVHTPEAGAVTGYRYLPGQLWPVFPAATRKVQGLFDRNERLVFALDTAAADRSWGTVGVAMIGAFGVGRMTTVVSPLITNTRTAAEDVLLDPPATLARCGELGRFHLGSTVILLLQAGTIEWTIQPGQDVRLGQPIGRAPTPA